MAGVNDRRRAPHQIELVDVEGHQDHIDPHFDARIHQPPDPADAAPKRPRNPGDLFVSLGRCAAERDLDRARRKFLEDVDELRGHRQAEAHDGDHTATAPPLSRTSITSTSVSYPSSGFFLPRAIHQWPEAPQKRLPAGVDSERARMLPDLTSISGAVSRDSVRF